MENMIYKVLEKIGDITLILFTLNILIFIIAIIIFRKWSKERFID